jgi:hypothetical protein
MTHVWGYRIPVLVAPVLALFTVGAVVFLWRGRGRRRPWPTLERVLLAGAVVGASAVTMTPTSFLDPEVFGRARRSCALTPRAVGWDTLLADDQRLLNVLLLVPAAALGVVVATRLRRRAGLALVAGVAALPALFEAVQWAFPDLNRACDATDLLDNLTGVAAGLLVGAGLATLRWAVRRKVGIVAA